MTIKKSTFRSSEPSKRTRVSSSFQKTYDSISGKSVSTKSGRLVGSKGARSVAKESKKHSS